MFILGLATTGLNTALGEFKYLQILFKDFHIIYKLNFLISSFD